MSNKAKYFMSFRYKKPKPRPCDEISNAKSNAIPHVRILENVSSADFLMCAVK